MQDVVLDHLSEDVLERYVLRNVSGEERELVECHILGCEECIARLEDLDGYVAAFKVASKELAWETHSYSQIEPNWRMHRFTPGKLAWAAVFALLLVSLLPRFVTKGPAAIPLRVNVSAWRGVDVATVATGRALDVQLNSTDLPAGTVLIQLVDARGKELWRGPASVRDESVKVVLPALSRRDNYFVRLYSVSSHGNAYGDLLREFGLRAK